MRAIRGPEYFLEYQGLVYFGAFEPGAGAQLWVTDPATDSTYLAVRNNEFMGRFGKPRDLIIFNDNPILRGAISGFRRGAH